MTVIYFTDGTLIDDTLIRRSLLRIPEVISALKKAQNEFMECDLFLVMNELQPYLQLNHHQRSHLKKVIQTALFCRWQSHGGKPDLIIRRQDYSDIADLTEIFKKLATVDSLNVITIGPGFDELESFLRLRVSLSKYPLIDCISQDPHLQWFWSDVRSSLELHS